MAFALDRSFSSTSVAPNAIVTVTYSGATGFTGIVETMPTGWSLVAGQENVNNTQGNEVRAFFSGTSKTIQYKASSTTGNFNFAGTYESTSGSGNIAGTSQVTVTGTPVTPTPTPNPNTSSSSNSSMFWIIGIIAVIIAFVFMVK